MIRIVSLLLLACVFVPAADARTPARVCRKACAPLVSSICPSKGRVLGKCRRLIVRACRQEGVGVCAVGTPTGTPGGDGSTTTTTTVSPPLVTTTTTTIPATVPADVAGTWDFEGGIVQRGCGFDASYDSIESTLVVSQQGSALSGTTEGATASGNVSGSGWTFTSAPDCRRVLGTTETCCVTFSVSVDGFASPATATGTAVQNCALGFICQTHWTGSVTKGS